jgi:sarcosine oxidase subunit beta
LKVGRRYFDQSTSRPRSTGRDAGQVKLREAGIVARTADVIIIGSGIVGASTALELSRQGRKVVVIDKAGGPGFGSTSASSAVVRFNYSTWDGVASAWESRFRWEEWEDHLGFRDPTGMASFVRSGLAFLDVDLIPRERMTSMFDRADIPYELWDAAALAAKVPGIDAGRYFPPKPVGSDAFFDDATSTLGAVFTPDAGYIDDPQLAAANLAHAAESLGAEFLFRTTVTTITELDSTWKIGLGDGDEIHAGTVVNAAGPWSTQLNAMAGVGGDFTIEVAPMRQEVHHVPLPSSLTTLDGPIPILADVDLGTYIRADSTHSLLVGGTEPDCDPLEWITDPDESNPRPTLERFEAQVFRAARRLPDLAVPNQPRGVAGVYDAASDWTPIYDKTDKAGFFVAMGTSGNQFKNAPLIGDLMSTVIHGVEDGHDHDATPLSYTAPHTGHRIDLGSFSRRRQINEDSSGTVMG